MDHVLHKEIPAEKFQLLFFIGARVPSAGFLKGEGIS